MLDGFYCAAPYKNFLVKKLINQFKYEPFAKELSKPLVSLIIAHFHLLAKRPSFLDSKNEFILVPVPISKKILKWQRFNPAEEIGKELSKFLKIPLISNDLTKDKELIKDKKILLVDDVFIDGSALKECAKTLKEFGAKKVWGIVTARE
ncbi:ComF family protein [Patescibacteria group bacterium]